MTHFNIPDSVLPYPDGLWNRCKYYLWHVYAPFHPWVRDTALTLRVVRHAGRQPFLLGTLAEGVSVKEFVDFLIARGYANHFVAWQDEGEAVSLRFLDSFHRQYHLRVFDDGEVRGHYEYTPEGHPILHLLKTDMQSRREDFLKTIGEKIIAQHE